MSRPIRWRRIDGLVHGQPIARYPAEYAPRIKSNRQIEPALFRPDVADVCAPLLIKTVSAEIMVGSIAGNQAAMIAVRSLLVVTFFLIQG